MEILELLGHVLFLAVQPINLLMILIGVTVGVTDLNESFYAVYFDYIELGLIERETYSFKPFSQKQIPPRTVGGDASSEPKNVSPMS